MKEIFKREKILKKLSEKRKEDIDYLEKNNTK